MSGEDRALLVVLVVAAVLMLASESLWAILPEFQRRRSGRGAEAGDAGISRPYRFTP